MPGAWHSELNHCAFRPERCACKWSRW